MPRRRPLGTIVFAGVVGFALGLTLGSACGFLLAQLRGAPAPAITFIPLAMGVATSVVSGVTLAAITSSMLAQLRVARLGSLMEKRAVAIKPRGWLDARSHSSHAAVAIEAGELDHAARALGRIPAVASKDGGVTLVRARYALARGDATAIEALIAWEHPKLNGRAFIAETRRYHAYILGKTLCADRDRDRRARGAARLLAASDPEVRAYGAWLVALDEGGLPREMARVALADLLLGAALARHEGLVDVARTLDARAVQLAADGRSGPYRD